MKTLYFTKKETKKEEKKKERIKGKSNKLTGEKPVLRTSRSWFSTGLFDW